MFRRSMVVLALIVSVLLAPGRAEAAGQIAGDVVDANNVALQDVSVDVLSGNSTTASTITDANGHFTFSLTGGPYDLRFTPPPSSGLQTYFLVGIDPANTGDLTVVLSPAQVVHLAGQVIDSTGKQYPGTRITFYPLDQSRPTTEVVTGSDGSYALDIISGQYRFIEARMCCLGDHFATTIYANANSPQTPWNLNADRTLDISVPMSKLTIHMNDASGNPVSNFAFKYYNMSGTSVGADGTFYNNIVYNYQQTPIYSDGTGSVSLWVPTNSSVGLSSAVLSSGLAISMTIPTVSADTSITVDAPASVHVSGQVIDSTGRVYPNTRLTFYPYDQSKPATVVNSDNSGSYSLDVVSGAQFRFVEARMCCLGHFFATTMYADASATQSPWTFNADRTLDVRVPMSTLTVNVQDDDGNAVADFGVKYYHVGASATGSNGELYESASFGYQLPPTPSNGTGQVTLVMPKNGIISSTSVILPSGLTIPFTVPQMTVDRSVTVNVPASAHLTGQVKDSSGRIYPGTQLTFYRSDNQPATVVHTDGDGRYSVDMLEGQYSFVEARMCCVSDFFISTMYADANNPQIPWTFEADRTLDFTVPVAQLTINVREASGEDVPNFGFKYHIVSGEAPGVDGALYNTFILNSRQTPLNANGDGSVNMFVPKNSTMGSTSLVLPSGLTLPVSLPQMTHDRNLYVLIDLTTGTAIVDVTAPTVTGTPERGPDHGIWYNHPVTVNWTAVDPIPSSGTPTSPAPTIVATNGRDQYVTSSESCDPANNCSTGRYGPLNLDSTKPLVSVSGVANGATYQLGSVPTVSCSASDELSGVDVQPTLAITGGNADGSGTFVATCSGATDAAGNVGDTVSVTYQVNYVVTSGGIGGSAGGPVDAPPAVNSGRAGRVYAAQWTLASADGTPITSLSSVSSVTYRSVACATFSGTSAPLEAESSGGSGLRVSGNTFAYNWKTPSTAGCYILDVNLADGQRLSANFDLS